MAGANGDAFMIEDGSHIVGMHSFDDEAYGTGFLLRRSNQAYAFDGRKCRKCNEHA